MAAGNHSTVTEFILAGLTEQLELQLPLLLLFLGIYVVTVVGNLGMIILIGLSCHLHTPMYYLLSSLSFIDLCQSTAITPKMLVNFVAQKNTISYPECMTQLYFFLVFAVAECYMLAAMAYDRYVAICSPLLYNVIMSHKVCFSLIVGVYTISTVCASVYTGCMFRIYFCKLNVINHYFCDLISILKLSCSSTYAFIVVGINIIVPSLTIFLSYGFILSSIFQINSTEGRFKAFSTCSSHIIAVILFFGSGAFMYLKPSSAGTMDEGKISSVFYTNVVPMMNPLIYSLRTLNRRKFCSKIVCSL
uniref:Olfactory receptor n=1 Tax=Oryctolagus cuniculus TaxID=9986 RepID=A0A5F9CRP8_RABIT